MTINENQVHAAIFLLFDFEFGMDYSLVWQYLEAAQLILTQFLKSYDVILGFPLTHELLLTHLAAFRWQSSSSDINGLLCLPCKDFENSP